MMRLWRRRRPAPPTSGPFIGYFERDGRAVVPGMEVGRPVVDPLKVAPGMTDEQRSAVMAGQQAILDRVLRADRVLAADLPVVPAHVRCTRTVRSGRGEPVPCLHPVELDPTPTNLLIWRDQYVDWLNSQLKDGDWQSPAVVMAAAAEARGVRVPAAARSARLRAEDVELDPAKVQIICQSCDQPFMVDLSPVGLAALRELWADELADRELARHRQRPDVQHRVAAEQALEDERRADWEAEQRKLMERAGKAERVFVNAIQSGASMSEAYELECRLYPDVA